MRDQYETAPGSLATIEPATWRDLNALRHIEQICFPTDAWPLWDLIGVLTMPNIVRLKAVVDGNMVGFIAGDVRTGQHMAWVATVCVLPEYRSRGIGAALMQACEAQIKEPSIRLNVRVSNASAIHLYQSLGYRRVGSWPGYYQDGEDALVMEKQRQSEFGAKSQKNTL
jgi:ribosomal-protein-alanine N-acetyltransferase